MTTVRTPIERRQTKPITARAVELYVAMGKLRCTCPQPKPVTHSVCQGCERWYDLHGELHGSKQPRPEQQSVVRRTRTNNMLLTMRKRRPSEKAAWGTRLLRPPPFAEEP